MTGNGHQLEDRKKQHTLVRSFAIQFWLRGKYYSKCSNSNNRFGEVGWGCMGVCVTYLLILKCYASYAYLYVPTVCGIYLKQMCSYIGIYNTKNNSM